MLYTCVSQIQFLCLYIFFSRYTQSPYSYVWMNDTNTPEIINGPSKKTMYVTALYFTMTCMTVSNPFSLEIIRTRIEKKMKRMNFFFGCFAPDHCLHSHSIYHKFLCLSRYLFFSLLFIGHLLIGLQPNSRVCITNSVFNVQCVLFVSENRNSINSIEPMASDSI